MIESGLQLTLLGMCVVFIFLIFLVVSITLVGKVLMPFTKRELEELNKETQCGDKRRTLLAVIAAAINKYRKGR